MTTMTTATTTVKMKRYTWCVLKVRVLIFYLIICWTYLKLQVISFEV